MGPGQLVTGIIAALSQLIHRSAARIANPQHPGHLVKALPRRVVPGSTQDLHISVALYVHDHGVAAGDTETHKGGLQVGVGDVVGGDMGPDMMDRDDGHIEAVGHRLSKVHAHQQGANEAGGIGYRHGVDVAPGDPRLSEGLVGQPGDGLDVFAGGNLRHHAAVNGVHIRLGGNGVGQDGAAVPHHRHGSLVAGGFNGKNIHGSFLLSAVSRRNMDHPAKQNRGHLTPIQPPVGILKGLFVQYTGL